jgi:hypothetical protein
MGSVCGIAPHEWRGAPTNARRSTTGSATLAAGTTCHTPATSSRSALAGIAGYEFSSDHVHADEQWIALYVLQNRRTAHEVKHYLKSLILGGVREEPGQVVAAGTNDDDVANAECDLGDCNDVDPDE